MNRNFICSTRKERKSIPDATITQSSFKIVVETKFTNCFKRDQLIKHLTTFKNEEYKVLITLSPKLMSSMQKKTIDKAITDYK